MQKSGRLLLLSIAFAVPEAEIPVGRGGTGEVPAGREAHDADTLRVDVESFALSRTSRIARWASSSGAG